MRHTSKMSTWRRLYRWASMTLSGRAQCPRDTRRPRRRGRRQRRRRLWRSSPSPDGSMALGGRHACGRSRRRHQPGLREDRQGLHTPYRRHQLSRAPKGLLCQPIASDRRDGVCLAEATASPRRSAQGLSQVCQMRGAKEVSRNRPRRRAVLRVEAEEAIGRRDAKVVKTQGHCDNGS